MRGSDSCDKTSVTKQVQASLGCRRTSKKERGQVGEKRKRKREKKSQDDFFYVACDGVCLLNKWGLPHKNRAPK